MNRSQLLSRIETAWSDLQQSFAGLSQDELQEPGVAGDWSVKDVLAHVTSWDEEALTALPVIAAGRRPARYGGVDNFNAREVPRRRSLGLEEGLERLGAAHERLLAYLASQPESLFATETRFRHRLRLDTYSHYPEHARAIRAWRESRRL